MDYEKKYKRALGWMQSIYPTMIGADKEDAEHFFPELKESEDERIRKYFIAKFKKMLEEDNLQPLGTVDASKLLAWLEKQGEPKWTEEDESRVKQIIYFLDTAKVHYVSTTALDNCIEWLNSLKQRRRNEL